MRMAWGAFGAAMLMAGLAAGMPAAAGRPVVERISYETGVCFGACPAYTVTVGSDGAGTFEGRNFAAVHGVRHFRVTPAEFEAFRRKLAPWRPARERLVIPGKECANPATDMPTVGVRWSGRSAAHLAFYYGCDMDRNRALATALREAPALLPIAGFIGTPHLGRR